MCGGDYADTVHTLMRTYDDVPTSPTSGDESNDWMDGWIVFNDIFRLSSYVRRHTTTTRMDGLSGQHRNDTAVRMSGVVLADGVLTRKYSQVISVLFERVNIISVLFWNLAGKKYGRRRFQT